jgi:aryl-alcohol dehydrogenase-like predicted oxidoreductase
MKLALGTVQFGLDYGVANSGGRVSEDEARAILAEAAQSGMDTLDTAIAYGDSERVLGGLGVSQWQVVTKLPSVPVGCDDVVSWVEREIQQSMARLNVTQLHGVLLHRPVQLVESRGQELYRGLQVIKENGLTQKIGVSVYEPAELDQLFDRFDLDLVQAPLNILDRRLVESGWAKQLKNAGVELHTRSAFLQGLLLMPVSERPGKFNRWSDIWSVWDKWLDDHSLSPLQACLRYLNSVLEVDRVVVGVDSVAQLNQIIGASGGVLEDLPKWNVFQDLRVLNPSSWADLS